MVGRGHANSVASEIVRKPSIKSMPTQTISCPSVEKLNISNQHKKVETGSAWLDHLPPGI